MTNDGRSEAKFIKLFREEDSDSAHFHQKRSTHSSSRIQKFGSYYEIPEKALVFCKRWIENKVIFFPKKERRISQFQIHLLVININTDSKL